MTLAKGIASGMPLGALLARESVMQWNDGGHGSTFGGNPVSVAAALATLRLLEGGLVENADAVGDHLHGGPCARGSLLMTWSATSGGSAS